MRRRFFVVSDFKQTDTGSYTIRENDFLKHEKFMDEELLVDLLRDIDVSLLQDDFIMQDMEFNRGNILNCFYQEKAKADISGRFNIRVKAVKSKMNYLAGIVSGVAAAVVLLSAAVAWLIKKTAVQQN